MKIDDRFRNVEGKICLLNKVSSTSKETLVTGLTWKEIVIELRDGSGDASIAASAWGYREGIAISAARQRMENGRLHSNAALEQFSLQTLLGS